MAGGVGGGVISVVVIVIVPYEKSTYIALYVYNLVKSKSTLTQVIAQP